jgi:hypothetical protein
MTEQGNYRGQFYCILLHPLPWKLKGEAVTFRVEAATRHSGLSVIPRCAPASHVVTETSHCALLGHNR